MKNVSLLGMLCGMLVGALLVACGGMAQRKAQQPPPGGVSTEDATAGTMTRPSTDDPRQKEILELDKQIREWRTELDLPTDPPLSEREAWSARTLPEAVETCTDDREPQTPRCQDVCRLADHICENAGEICRISGDLPENPWAEDKCNSAKVSCKDGEERCCTCKGEELGIQ